MRNPAGDRYLMRRQRLAGPGQDLLDRGGLVDELAAHRRDAHPSRERNLALGRPQAGRDYGQTRGQRCDHAREHERVDRHAVLAAIRASA